MKKEELQNTVLLVDKPKGMSSFDVIRVLRKKLGIKKMGHSGTLDPLATGLLIIGVGDGTKKLKEFLKLPKTYEVEILLGVQTDTGDLEGQVLKKEPMLGHPVSKYCVEAVLRDTVGALNLPVPAYSAVKQKGVPLYKRARRGELVEPPVKKMEIRNIELLDIRQEGEHVVLKIRMDVGSGTYVRSVAEEIGRQLGVPSVVKELRRTKIGEFDVRDAKKLDDF